MAKLSTVKANTTRRVVVYGPPKSGKTEIVGKLAEHFNLIWFDLENGFATLLKLPNEQQERIELIQIPDTKVFPIAIETMLKVITGAKTEICEAHGKVSCPLCKKESAPTVSICLNEIDENTLFVVDSLTQLSVSAINHITKNQSDDYKYDWDDYRKQGTLMDKFLSQVQQARFNVVCITHETETEMDDGKKRIVPVAGTTSFSRNAAKYFDDVVHVEVKNRKHIAASATTHSSTLLTGSRTNAHVEDGEEPSLLRIFKPELFGEVAKPGATQSAPGNKALSALDKLRLAKSGG